MLDLLAEVVLHAGRWHPAQHVLVDVDTHHLVGREKAILDALPEAVGVDRLAKVGGAGDVLSLLGGGGEAELDAAGEVFEDFAPLGILGGAAPVTFVDDDQVEEIRGDVSEDLVVFVRAGDSLIEAQIDLVRRIDGALADLGHHLAEGLEVVDQGLVDQDVTIGEEQRALYSPGLPQPPDNLEGGVGLAGAGGHDQQHALLSLGNGLDGAVNGLGLVIAGLLARDVLVVGLGHQWLGAVIDAAPLLVAGPEGLRARKLIQRKLGFNGLAWRGDLVMGSKGVTIGAKGAGDVEDVGIAQALLQALADGVLVVLCLHHRQRNAGFPEQHIVGELLLFLVARGDVAADHDRPRGQGDFAANLLHGVPARIFDGRGDEKVANIGLAQALLLFVIHADYLPVGPDTASA